MSASADASISSKQAMITQGPSLPPNIKGGLVGTLVIRFLDCTMEQTFARIQFWGESAFNDLRPCHQELPSTDNIAEVSFKGPLNPTTSVEYPLVGTDCAVRTYFKDASPMPIKIFRWSSDQGLLESPCSAEFKPVWVGWVYIPEISVPAIMHDAHEISTTKIFIQQLKLKVKRTIANVEESVGEVIFEFVFRMIGLQSLPPITQTLLPSHLDATDNRDFSNFPSNPGQQVSQVNQRLPERGLAQNEKAFGQHGEVSTAPMSCQSRNFQSQLLTLPESLHHHEEGSTKHTIDGMMEQQMIQCGSEYDSCNSQADEHQSLLEELLDLCGDEMTIPSIGDVGSTSEAIRSYSDDLWISKMLSNAGDPPPSNEFPSLIPHGSNQSSALKQIHKMKLVIGEVSVSDDIAHGIKGRHRFYLKYNIPPMAVNLDKSITTTNPTTRTVQFMICERGKSMAKCKKDSDIPNGKKYEEIQILENEYTKEFGMVFDDDEIVRSWMGTDMKFDMFYVTPKSGNRPNKPKSSQSRYNRFLTDPPTTKAKALVPIGSASAHLREVILSESFDFHARLDLKTDNGTEIIHAESRKIGSLLIGISLIPVLEEIGSDFGNAPIGSQCQRSCSVLENTIGNQNLEISSDVSTQPHPISAFLAKFAQTQTAGFEFSTEDKMKNDSPVIDLNKERFHQPLSTTIENGSSKNQGTQCIVSEEDRLCGSTPSHIDINIDSENNHCINDNQESVALPSNVNLQSTVLKPINPPPIWLNVSVSRLAGLDLKTTFGQEEDVVGRCLQLSIMCPVPFSSINETSRQLVAGNKGCVSRSRDLVDKTFDLSVSSVDTSKAVDCSWHVALNEDIKRNTDSHCQIATATIKIFEYCLSDFTHDSKRSQQSDRKLIGFSEIPFSLEQVNCILFERDSTLPRIAVNGWFPIMDRDSKSSIGKIAVIIAIGSLRQIRRINVVSGSALRIQEWWRKKYRVSTIDPPSPGRNASNRKLQLEKENSVSNTIDNFDSEKVDSDKLTRVGPDTAHDTIHAQFTMKNGKMNIDTCKESGASPDSLYDDWISDRHPDVACISSDSSAANVDRIPLSIALPNKKGDQLANINSSEVKDIDTSNVLAPNENFNKREDFAGSNSTLHVSDSRNPSSYAATSIDEFDVDMCVERISGVREIINLWCNQKEDRFLLPDSGVVVTYCVALSSGRLSPTPEKSNAGPISDEYHSSLFLLDDMDQDPELNLKEVVPITNFETNLGMIQNQAINFKLWFVPIITKCISTAIADDKLKVSEVLNGCAVVAVTSLPLYHLYTRRGYFRGKIPWEVSISENQDARKTVGYIAITVCRAGCQISSLNASFMDKSFSPSNPNQTNRLAKKDECPVKRVQEDPPEENYQPIYPKRNKRKFEERRESAEKGVQQIFSTENSKRHRISSQLGSSNEECDDIDENKLSPKPRPLNMTDAHPLSDAGGTRVEPCPEGVQDTNDTLSSPCRSLSSVLGSLDNIHYILKSRDSFRPPWTEDDSKKTNDDADEELEIICDSKSKPLEAEFKAEAASSSGKTKHSPKCQSVKQTNSGCLLSKQDARADAPSSNSEENCVVKSKTCEKACSPIYSSKASFSHFDASTSPPGSSLSHVEKEQNDRKKKCSDAGVGGYMDRATKSAFCEGASDEHDNDPLHKPKGDHCDETHEQVFKFHPLRYQCVNSPGNPLSSNMEMKSRQFKSQFNTDCANEAVWRNFKSRTRNNGNFNNRSSHHPHSLFSGTEITDNFGSRNTSNLKSLGRSEKLRKHVPGESLQRIKTCSTLDYTTRPQHTSCSRENEVKLKSNTSLKIDRQSHSCHKSRAMVLTNRIERIFSGECGSKNVSCSRVSNYEDDDSIF